MTKLFKLLADMADIFSSFSMMPPCPVPLRHSGSNVVRVRGVRYTLGDCINEV